MLRSAVQTAFLGQIESELCRDLDLIAERFEGAANNGLAHVGAVHFSRVEECHALAVGLTNDLDGFVDGAAGP